MIILCLVSLAGIGAFDGQTAVFAEGGAVTLKYSHGYPVGTKESPYFIHKLALLFQEYTEEATQGRVKTKIFPASQLFKAKAEIEACRRGDVDVVSTPSVYAAKYNKLENIRFFPVITSYPQVAKWSSNQKILEMNRQVYEEKIGKLKFLGYIPTPVYKMMWTKKPIQKLEDLKGLKIRSGSKQKGMFKAVGASCELISSGEVVTALQTGMVDGCYMSYSWARSNSLWEFTTYASPQGIMPFSSIIWEPLLINKNAWAKISKADQDAIATKVVPKITAEMKDFMFKLEDDTFTLFKSKGVRFSWLSGKDLDTFTTRRDGEVKKALAKYKITDYYEIVKKIVAD
jgi:TRAP-type C4-dicarboxylate transport system substrate-binding protein